MIPLDLVYDILNGETAAERKGSTIRIRLSDGDTVVKSRKLDVHTHDGLIVEECVTVRTAVPSEYASFGTSHWNHLAGLSAFMVSKRRSYLVSRFSIYKDDDSAMVAYGRLVALTALLQSDWKRHVGRLYTAPDTAPAIELADQEPRWDERDFDDVASNLRRKGLCTNYDSGGLTSEFPWEPGAYTAALHHRTSLFTMRKTRNPLLGHGLLLKLELPAVFKDPGAVSDSLNAAEYGATDAVPFAGAWCPAQAGNRVAFVTFLPNLAYSLGMHVTMAVWSLHRSIIAQDLIEDAAIGAVN